jgi:purine-binding chemotaxis protein CheW
MSLADAMREQFDLGFARARPARVPLERLLELKVGGELHAVRLAQLGGVFVDPRLAPMPSTALGFLGLAGLRAALIPVFSLATLLGYPPSTATPRWWVTTRGASPVGFAFEHFERYLHLPAAQLSPRPGAASAAVREAVLVDGVRRPVIDLFSLSADLHRELKEL